MRQTLNELFGDVGPLSYQYESLCVFKAHGELPEAFDGIGVNFESMTAELGGAVKFSNRVLIVVEDGYVHALIVPCERQNLGDRSSFS